MRAEIFCLKAIMIECHVSLLLIREGVCLACPGEGGRQKILWGDDTFTSYCEAGYIYLVQIA